MPLDRATRLISCAGLVLASSCTSSTAGRTTPVAHSAPKPTAHRSVPRPTQAREASYPATIDAIADGIERLKSRFPQLASFSRREHCDPQRLVISYAYRTHRSQRRGGWAAAVPNPDDDGVWFYIDFHDPSSQAQIHTQPSVPELRYRDKRVLLLILEGARTRSLEPELEEILRTRGVTSPHERLQ